MKYLLLADADSQVEFESFGPESQGFTGLYVTTYDNQHLEVVVGLDMAQVAELHEFLTDLLKEDWTR